MRKYTWGALQPDQITCLTVPITMTPPQGARVGAPWLSVSVKMGTWTLWAHRLGMWTAGFWEVPELCSYIASESRALGPVSSGW